MVKGFVSMLSTAGEVFWRALLVLMSRAALTHIINDFLLDSGRMDGVWVGHVLEDLSATGGSPGETRQVTASAVWCPHLTFPLSGGRGDSVTFVTHFGVGNSHGSAQYHMQTGNYTPSILAASFPVWRCVRLPRTYTRCPHCLTAPLPFHIAPSWSYHTPVLLHCAHNFLQTVLTPSHSSSCLVWNTAGYPDPRQRDSQSLLRTTWRQHMASQCNAWRQALQQKPAAEWNMEGDLAFSQHSFKISHPSPRQ